jgi:hypothetical protein
LVSAPNGRTKRKNARISYTLEFMDENRLAGAGPGVNTAKLSEELPHSAVARTSGDEKPRNLRTLERANRYFAWQQIGVLGAGKDNELKILRETKERRLRANEISQGTRKERTSARFIAIAARRSS